MSEATLQAPLADDSAWRGIAWALARDLKLALRSRAELGVQLLFYVIVVTLFPLGIGPEPGTLRTLGPGVLWVAALLASLLALVRGQYRLHGRINVVFFTLTLAAVLGLELIVRVISPNVFEYIRANPSLSRALNIHLCFSVPSADCG